MKQKQSWGGARPNSGPKAKDRVRLTIAFDRDIAEWVSTQKEKRSDFINLILRRAKDESKVFISKAKKSL